MSIKQKTRKLQTTTQYLHKMAQTTADDKHLMLVLGSYYQYTHVEALEDGVYLNNYD